MDGLKALNHEGFKPKLDDKNFGEKVWALILVYTISNMIYIPLWLKREK